ncbi:MAG: hydrogenase large subunit [Candidatus Baldrarchaeia archaeon]
MSEERMFRIPVGPQHPALKEPINFTFIVDGERVVDVKPRIGYNHRGIEKLMESKTYIQGLYLIERICGICSAAHQGCYAQNIEEAAGIEAPPRGVYLRTLIWELERIHSHLLWVGVAYHEIGFDTLFMYVWRDRERVMDILEMISGNRVNYAMNTIGGVRRDVTPEIVDNALKALDYLEERTKYYKKVTEEDDSILARTVNVGILKTEDAKRLCAVGPTARASGLKVDVRRDDPYGAYDELDFDVVVYDTCDLTARVLVRIDEVLESIKMCRQILQNLPSGPVRVKFKRKVPEGESISKVEAPRGEDLHYVKANGTEKPERYKVRAPTLANIPSVCEMLKGGYIADIPIVFAGIDPCIACTDRMLFIDVNTERKWMWTEEELRMYARKWYKKHLKEVVRERWKC